MSKLEFPEGKKIFWLLNSTDEWWKDKTKTPELIKAIKEEFAERTPNGVSIEVFVHMNGKYFDVPELMWFDSDDSPKVKMFYCKFLTRFCNDTFEKLILEYKIDPLKIVETAAWLTSDEFEEEAAKQYPNNGIYAKRLTLIFLSWLVQFCKVPSDSVDLATNLRKILLPIFMMREGDRLNQDDISILKKFILDFRKKYSSEEDKQLAINKEFESLYSEYKIDNGRVWKFVIEDFVKINKELLVAIVPRFNAVLLIGTELFEFIEKCDIKINDPRYQQIINMYRDEIDFIKKNYEGDEFEDIVVEKLSYTVQLLEEAMDNYKASRLSEGRTK